MKRRFSVVLGLVLVLNLFLPGIIGAQSSWKVIVTATMDPLPVGFCAAVHLTAFDESTHDVPRNPLGYRVTISDFDIAVAPNGGAVIAKRIDASHWETCACRGAAVGAVVKVTATYPAQSLPVASQVPGMVLQSSASFALSAAKGQANPSGCVAPPPGTVASSNPPAAAAPTATAPPSPAAAPAAPPPPALAPPPAPAPAPLPPAPPAPVPLAGQPLGTRVAPVAAPPAPAPYFSNATPVLLTVRWPSISGVTSWVITRSQPNAPDQTVEISDQMFNPPSWTSLPPTQPAFHDKDLLPSTVATYVVRAVFSDGRESATTVQYTMLPPVNPPGLVANQTGTDRVHLQWVREDYGQSHFMVFGPGSAQGGVRVSGADDHYDVTGVPAGSQEWAVASYYEPGPIATAAADFSRVRLDVAAAASAAAPAAVPVVSGRYLVTVTGLRAFWATVDDPLSRDGKGDEVYVAAFVRRYDRRTGAVAESDIRRTMTYGDVNNFGAQRLKAGSGSATGGIQDGDPIPSFALAAVRTVPAQNTTFPLRLWEGSLANDLDALVITPSIWEVDGTTGFSTLWEQQQEMLNLSLFTDQRVLDQITNRTFGPLAIDASGIGSGGAVGSNLRSTADFLLFTSFSLPLATILSTSADRPVGLTSSGPDQTVLPNAAVVLTREIIEAALAKPAAGMFPSPWLKVPGVLAPKPGVIMIEFNDGILPGFLGFPERPAMYQMFIQVERIP